MRTLNPPVDYLKLYTEGSTFHEGRPGHIPYKDRYDHDYGVAGLRWPKIMRRFRLLDVGCANGAFVRFAADRGMEAEGIELNPDMADWARKVTGLRIHTDWNTVDPPFDVITYHDVIEHIPDPREEVSRVTAYLKLGGVLAIDTPDVEDPRFERDGMDWRHMKPQEHLWFFREVDLLRLLESSGLHIENVDRPILGKVVVYARKESS